MEGNLAGSKGRATKGSYTVPKSYRRPKVVAPPKPKPSLWDRAVGGVVHVANRVSEIEARRNRNMSGQLATPDHNGLGLIGDAFHAVEGGAHRALRQIANTTISPSAITPTGRVRGGGYTYADAAKGAGLALMMTAPPGRITGPGMGLKAARLPWTAAQLMKEADRLEKAWKRIPRDRRGGTPQAIIDLRRKAAGQDPAVMPHGGPISGAVSGGGGDKMVVGKNLVLQVKNGRIFLSPRAREEAKGAAKSLIDYMNNKGAAAKRPRPMQRNLIQGYATLPWAEDYRRGDTPTLYDPFNIGY